MAEHPTGPFVRIAGGRSRDHAVLVSQPLLRREAMGTAKQAFHTEVFVNLGPVDPIASAGDDALGSLLRCCVQETRIPSKWR